MTSQPQSPPLTLVFFDGACPLCSREVRRHQRRDLHHRIQWIDIAAPNFNAAAYHLQPDQVQRVMHAITPDGRIHTQIAAFLQIWQALPPTLFTSTLRLLLKIPGMMPLANLLYRLFARNRYHFTGRCTPASCQLPEQPK